MMLNTFPDSAGPAGHSSQQKEYSTSDCKILFYDFYLFLYVQMIYFTERNLKEWLYWEQQEK